MDRFRIVYKWNSIRVWYDRKSKNALFEKLFKVVMKLLLVIDVGNTNTVLGVYHNGDLNYHWRIETSRHKTEDEFGMSIRALFDYVGLM
ncbi:type III pantothenate kinase, partial [Bacillus safensis]|uniref:type III pantothenate kinase n=1 Tax=Bacillus safensis TaxID=561879 RepID=UPI002280D219